MADTTFGEPVPRLEDRALVAGRGEFTDDLSAPRMTHLAILRSRHAHAAIERIDVTPAEDLDGVATVYTAADVEASDAPGVIPVAEQADVPGHPVLAGDRVRYQGQPVAAVVATDRYRARDAVRAIEVTYDRLDPVVDPAAARSAPALFESVPDNVAVDYDRGDADAVDAAFDDAEHEVELDLANNRVIPTPIEPRAALARPRGHDGLLVEMTSQKPHTHRSKLSETLGLSEDRIRLRSPDVGGGFGQKGHHHPGEALASFAALDLDRPVKWTATRTENYLAGAHGRDHRTRAALAFDDDGAFRAIRVETVANLGAYVLGNAAAMPTHVYGGSLTGQYDLPAAYVHVDAVLTNTAPVHSYRGAGQPEGNYVVERLVDAAARDLDVDPVELRRRNLIPPEDFPYETATGGTYDSGRYERALDLALDAASYADRRSERAEGRRDGRYLGIGVGCFTEGTGGGPEGAAVRVDASGSVTVCLGTHSQGQGHETVYAQVVADELGIEPDRVEVIEGDTGRVPQSVGTFGSRSAVAGGSALAECAGEVAERVRAIAAHHLEAEPSDLTAESGEIHVTGAPERSVSFAEVASAAYGGDGPEGMEPGLESTRFVDSGGGTTYGTHVAVVEVDPRTGGVEILDYVGVTDCGERINPTIVDGQIHGGVVQGIGQALAERAVYDDAGNLVTGGLQDYPVPTADRLPELRLEATETPSPNNPLGVKGVGEAGPSAAPPAVVNAVLDALAPLGVDSIDMPLTDERVWRAVRSANGE